jgi:CRISPR-associated protein Csb1
MSDLYERLRAACAGTNDDAMIVFRSRFEPEGHGTKTSPPTYPEGSVILVDDATGKRSLRTPYLIERRHIDDQDHDVVHLDSVQSQANRAEDALYDLVSSGQLSYPQLEIVVAVDGDRIVRIPSLHLPHRYADAYLRDSRVGGTPFDKTDVGRSLQLATPDDVTALYQWSPESLVFGAWNSQRKGRQAKFPRVYRSEVIGLDPIVGERRALRMDPANLEGGARPLPDGDWEYAVPDGAKVKGAKLSERGLGNIGTREPPPGGVTISGALRLGSLSFAGLRRLRFGHVSPEASVNARAAIAALALLADRAAFSAPSMWLRSGCDLVLVDDAVSFLRRGGNEERIDLSEVAALSLFQEAREVAQNAGIAMSDEKIELTPNEKNLGEAIRYAYLRATSQDSA